MSESQKVTTVALCISVVLLCSQLNALPKWCGCEQERHLPLQPHRGMFGVDFLMGLKRRSQTTVTLMNYRGVLSLIFPRVITPLPLSRPILRKISLSWLLMSPHKHLVITKSSLLIFEPRIERALVLQRSSVKETVSLNAIADWIICINGKFVSIGDRFQSLSLASPGAPAP